MTKRLRYILLPWLPYKSDFYDIFSILTKVHGRPIVNFELQTSYYHVLEDILEGDTVRMNVTVPSKFQKSILTVVSIELDYQVICEDKNGNLGL